MSEITLGTVRGLGLIARTELERQELDSVGQLIRPRLENPFDFLKEEFHWALNETRPGTALSTLAARLTSSLFLEPPKLESFRKGFVALTEVPEHALQRLESGLRDEFFLLLAETVEAVAPTLQTVTRLAA
jgi:hypothetical protein